MAKITLTFTMDDDLFRDALALNTRKENGVLCEGEAAKVIRAHDPAEGYIDFAVEWDR